MASWNIGGQACGNAVAVDPVVPQRLGLKKDAVTLALRETNDLILDRRAVPRADGLNLATVHRSPVQVRTNDFVGGEGRLGLGAQETC